MSDLMAAEPETVQGRQCRTCYQPVEIVGARNSQTGRGVVAIVAAQQTSPLGAVRCRTCGGNADWQGR